MHRVKVYKLDGTGLWVDRGTGHISVEFMQQADAMGLIVVSEEELQRTLLVHKISQQDIYNRSGEQTIITWSDKEINTDVAISFQEQQGCDQIWEQIKQVQREDKLRREQEAQAPTGTPHPPADVFETISGPPEDFVEVEIGPSSNNDGHDLPAPEMRNLEELAKILAHVQPYWRDKVATQLLKAPYIQMLLDLFKQCEDLEDVAGLGHMAVIVKGMIMLNEASLLEELLREEHVMDVIGALEYDPDLKVTQQHRQFLHTQVEFKEVVPITNAGVLARIHQTYRIQYLKDVILPRSLDDATYATLSSLALFNNVEVVSELQHDASFLSQLFERLASVQPGQQDWADLVAFLQELCGLARHLPQQQRQALFQKLVALGLFDVVTRIMLHSGDEAKLKATDILMSLMQHDVTALRTFLLKQEDNTLFACLMRELISGSEGGLPEQIAELTKVLLDPETMEQAVEKNEFLDLFYDQHLDRVLSVFLEDSSISKEGTHPVPAHTLGLVVELLCCCVQYHSYRIKYYALKHGMCEKVLRVVRRKERWLVCAAVRFLRVAVGMQDEFFNRYIMRNNLFEPILAAFFANGERYNLINSAVLDLLEFVRKENIKVLVVHLVETYRPQFLDIQYVDTFKQLLMRYQQIMAQKEEDEAAADGANNAGSNGHSAGGPLAGRKITFQLAGAGGRGPGRGVRRQRDQRDMDKDEEDYFSEDVDIDDEEGGSNEGPPPLQPTPHAFPPASHTAPDSSPPQKPWPGLVDYDDDDSPHASATPPSQPASGASPASSPAMIGPTPPSLSHSQSSQPNSPFPSSLPAATSGPDHGSRKNHLFVTSPGQSPSPATTHSEAAPSDAHRSPLSIPSPSAPTWPDFYASPPQLHSGEQLPDSPLMQASAAATAALSGQQPSPSDSQRPSQQMPAAGFASSTAVGTAVSGTIGDSRSSGSGVQPEALGSVPTSGTSASGSNASAPAGAAAPTFLDVLGQPHSTPLPSISPAKAGSTPGTADAQSPAPPPVQTSALHATHTIPPASAVPTAAASAQPQPLTSGSAGSVQPSVPGASPHPSVRDSHATHTSTSQPMAWQPQANGHAVTPATPPPCTGSTGGLPHSAHTPNGVGLQSGAVGTGNSSGAQHAGPGAAANNGGGSANCGSSSAAAAAAAAAGEEARKRFKLHDQDSPGAAPRLPLPVLTPR